MNMGFFKDPMVIFLSVFFGVAATSAIVWHAFVRRYLLALIAGTTTSTALNLAIEGITRDYPIGYSDFVGTFPICLAVTAAIGIPFYRERTGKGLGED